MNINHEPVVSCKIEILEQSNVTPCTIGIALSGKMESPASLQFDHNCQNLEVLLS